MGEVLHRRSCQSPGSTDSAPRGLTASTRGLTAATTRTDQSIGNVHCLLLALAASLALLITGCTPCREYFRNGFKVGPNYGRPPAPVAEHWIDASDQRVHSVDGDDCHWWTVFNDPVLSELIQTAYRQNLTLREAGFRILEARAVRGIAVGEMFPQIQEANGGYNRTGVSETVANRVA